MQFAINIEGKRPIKKVTGQLPWLNDDRLYLPISY